MKLVWTGGVQETQGSTGQTLFSLMDIGPEQIFGGGNGWGTGYADILCKIKFFSNFRRPAVLFLEPN